MEKFTVDVNAKQIEIFKLSQTHSVRHINLKAGEEIPEHAANADETVILLSGSIRFMTPDKEVTMTVGDFLVLPPKERHSLVSIEDSQVLVVLHK